MADAPRPRFTARPRRPPEGLGTVERQRLLDELAQLRARFDRAARDGSDAFRAPASDSYDIGMLAVIHLADFVGRELPTAVTDVLPEVARDGLRATRTIATHNYAGLDNNRVWETVSVSAPRLIDAIEAALRAL